MDVAAHVHWVLPGGCYHIISGGDQVATGHGLSCPDSFVFDLEPCRHKSRLRLDSPPPPPPTPPPTLPSPTLYAPSLPPASPSHFRANVALAWEETSASLGPSLRPPELQSRGVERPRLTPRATRSHSGTTARTLNSPMSKAQVSPPPYYHITRELTLPLLRPRRRGKVVPRARSQAGQSQPLSVSSSKEATLGRGGRGRGFGGRRRCGRRRVRGGEGAQGVQGGGPARQVELQEEAEEDAEGGRVG